MRTTHLVLGLVMACTSAAAAADTAPPKVMYLDGASSLARLRATNPTHFALAQRIISAANQLCRPGPDEVLPARLHARDFSCARMLLKTSNPPKREITFRLDDTRYIALVVVTDDPPRLVAVK